MCWIPAQLAIDLRWNNDCCLRGVLVAVPNSQRVIVSWIYACLWLLFLRFCTSTSGWLWEFLRLGTYNFLSPKLCISQRKNGLALNIHNNTCTYLHTSSRSKIFNFFFFPIRIIKFSQIFFTHPGREQVLKFPSQSSILPTLKHLAGQQERKSCL